VLTLHIPVAEKAKPRKVAVSSGDTPAPPGLAGAPEAVEGHHSCLCSRISHSANSTPRAPPQRDPGRCAPGVEKPGELLASRSRAVEEPLKLLAFRPERRLRSPLRFGRIEWRTARRSALGKVLQFGRPCTPREGAPKLPHPWAVVSTSHGHSKSPEAQWSASRAECHIRRSPAFQATPEALRVFTPPEPEVPAGPRGLRLQGGARCASTHAGSCT